MTKKAFIVWPGAGAQVWFRAAARAWCRNHAKQLLFAPRGHFFLGNGLRLQLSDILPARILARRRAAIDIAILDLEKRVLTQPGEQLANLGLHLRLHQCLLDLALDLLEGSLARLETFFYFEDHKADRHLDGIGDIALLFLEDDGFNLLIHRSPLHGADVAAVLPGFGVVGIIARQVAEFFALAAASHQVFGLLLRRRHLLGRLAFR